MALKYAGLCYRCKHFNQIDIDTYAESVGLWEKLRLTDKTVYNCKKLDKDIRKIRQTCKYFLDIQIPKLIIEVNGNMKITEIPAEAERIDLKDLPNQAELKAVSEKYKEAVTGSTGGLVILFEMRDKRTFSQKYSPMSGAVLVRALKKLKVKDTEELRKNWYLYELTPMRMGKPRMIPINKVKA